MEGGNHFDHVCIGMGQRMRRIADHYCSAGKTNGCQHVRVGRILYESTVRGKQAPRSGKRPKGINSLGSQADGFRIFSATKIDAKQSEH